MQVVFLVLMFIIGAMMGSFACCQAWRLRYREEGKKELGKWSVCLNCGRRLKWYENLPVVSWIGLRGKCRKCGAKIGAAEILSEIGLGTSFVLIGNYFGYGSLMAILKLVVVSLTMTGMWILVVYDAKWGRLPVKVLTFVNVCAIMYVILRIVGWHFGGPSVDFWNLLYAVGILAGVYYLLYFFSKERWVGSGDWLLALAISLLLSNWFLALVELFVANLLASVAGIFVIYKQGRGARISFGPFLVVAFVIVFILQDWLLGLVTLF